MFTRDSVIVKSWVKLIEEGRYTINDVPNISNLKEIVKEILDENKTE